MLANFKRVHTAYTFKDLPLSSLFKPASRNESVNMVRNTQVNMEREVFALLVCLQREHISAVFVQICIGQKAGTCKIAVQAVKITAIFKLRGCTACHDLFCIVLLSVVLGQTMTWF